MSTKEFTRIIEELQQGKTPPVPPPKPPPTARERVTSYLGRADRILSDRFGIFYLSLILLGALGALTLLIVITVFLVAKGIEVIQAIQASILPAYERVEAAVIDVPWWYKLAAAALLTLLAFIIALWDRVRNQKRSPRIVSMPEQTARERVIREDTAQSTAVRSNEIEIGSFRRQLEDLRTKYPELPVVPQTTLDYNGWFTEARSRFQMRSKHLTLEELNRLFTQIENLHSQYKKIYETRLSIDRVSHNDFLERLKTEKEIVDMEAALAEAIRARDVAKNPPKKEGDDSRRQAEWFEAETNRINKEIEFERAKQELAKLKNSSTTTGPKHEDEYDKLRRLFMERWEATEGQRMKAEGARIVLLGMVEELAGQGCNREHVERYTKKFFEEHYPGKSWDRSARASS